jgi:hypothetical protein
MFRIAVAAVTAPVVSIVVFGVLFFIGILMTTMGKQSAPSDHWVMFGSLAIGTFLGGLMFAVIAGQFTMPQAWSLIGLYAVLFVLFVAPTGATGLHGMPVVYQIPIALVVTSLSVMAGGFLSRPRKAVRNEPSS